MAYQYGNLIEVITEDETGGQDSVLELFVCIDRNETLEAAGYELAGEWMTFDGVPQVSVQEA